MSFQSARESRGGSGAGGSKNGHQALAPGVLSRANVGGTNIGLFPPDRLNLPLS